MRKRFSATEPCMQCRSERANLGGLSRSVDAAPAPIAPRQIPTRARRRLLRHIVDARCAKGVAAQQPCQRHPSASPQAEPRNRLLTIGRAGWQVTAIVTDKRRQRVPVEPDQRTCGIARQAPQCWCNVGAELA